MDIDPPPPPRSSTRKLKFAPKPQKHRKKTPVLHINVGDDDNVDAETASKLVRMIKEKHATKTSKVEKKSSGDVATPHVAESSTPVEKPNDRKKSSDSRKSAVKSPVISSPTTAKDGDFEDMVVDDDSGYSSNSENEYKEPFNSDSYIPISLPIRLPGSGNPEVLNEQEFGEEKKYDETKINSALELGLNGPQDSEKNPMIFFQFPEKLPLPVSSKGKEKTGSSSSANKHPGSLKDLPDGFMGKMLVYKSGAVKLKLGDTIFDVSSGSPFGCYQTAAMINTTTKTCCELGNVNKQAVVTPDLNSVLDNICQP